MQIPKRHVNLERKQRFMRLVETHKRSSSKTASQIPAVVHEETITLPVGHVPSIPNFLFPESGSNLPAHKNLYDAPRCKAIPSGLWIHK